MNWFDRLVEHRRFVYLIVALLTAAGIAAIGRLPSAIYPELTFSRITVVAEGTALDARQMVFSVTRPLEEAVSSVMGVTRVRSKSIRGASQIDLTFAPGSDMKYALQLVQTAVSQTMGVLPAGVSVEAERLTPSLFPIVSYNLEGGDPARLYDIARYDIRPVLSRVPGVGRVEVQGSDIREIEVVADPVRLASAGLTYDSVASAIQAAITPQAVGRMVQNYRQYLVVADQQTESPDGVGAIVVAPGVRVRDVAAVSLGIQDRTLLISGDGKPAAQISVSRQLGGNTLQVADSVAATLRALAPTLPAGVRIVPVYDQAQLVRDAVKSVRDAMLIGALLAVIVLLAFLRRGRITIISASAIPLTLIITVFVMGLLGQTFNLMTLGAMAIAIGLVIDDAVVITENVARHLALTGERHRAVREALAELVWPVTTSTLTTVVVFLPLGLLEGVVGQFFVALSITLTIAVLVSLLLAMTLIPLLCARYLKAEPLEETTVSTNPTGVAGRVGWWIARGLDSLSERYARGLSAALRHPRRGILVGVLLLLAGIGIWTTVGTGFLPEMDEGAFVLDYVVPGGTSLPETDRQLRIVEGILARIPEVSATSRRTGAEMGLYATAQNTGDIVVRLVPQGRRSRDIFAVMDEVRSKVNQAVPRLRIEFVQILSDVINDLAGAARPVEIKLFGTSLPALEQYGRQLGVQLDSVSGLEDLYNGVSEPSSELRVTVNDAAAQRAGLNPDQVAAAVRGALLGAPAGAVRVGDRTIGVRVRAPDALRYDALRLGTLPVLKGQGATTPLDAVATIQPEETRAELDRENQQQMITMTADVSGRSLGGVMTDVRRVLAANPPPAGIRVELGGQYAGQQKAFHALLLVLALAGTSVVGIMVLQFRSFVEPLIVVLAAPLSFGGGLLLLLITGTQLNVSSFMGLILLVGLVVKNGIILLDFTRLRMEEAGLPLGAAVVEAARIRLRPILMTTLCTLFGLFPLALGLGAGSALQTPLALAVIGGLALSTPITLFLVPTLLVAIRGADAVL